MASPLDGHEFEQASGFGDGQESLVCCSPWGHIKSDVTTTTRDSLSQLGVGGALLASRK